MGEDPLATHRRPIVGYVTARVRNTPAGRRPGHVASVVRTSGEVVALVRAHGVRLRGMTRLLDFERFAAEHGLRREVEIARFVRALWWVLGVDLAAIRALTVAQLQLDPSFAAQARRGPQMALSCAGTATHFAVAGPDGNLIWHDRYPHDAIHTAIGGAEHAARRAIWVAFYARVGWGARAARLRLTVARGHGLDLLELHHHALAADVLLELVADPVDNPAAARVGDAPTLVWRGCDPATLLASNGESL
ncbi:hypothetical protein [Nocardia takedensis]|uniref:hypothetical protein n=1 Tax=Nocardia takedensis TaxID=259390 RepID=UPI0012F6C151|nr:hypothetical protein [Nocardia takedensis]